MNRGNPKPMNWKEVVWYAWVIGAVLIVVNASIAYFLGPDGIPELWGV